MDYGEILSKSWKIIWKFKVLWIFGIFASCGTRNGTNFNFNSNFRTGAPSGQPPVLPPGFENNMLNLLRFFENPAVIIGFISIICILILLSIFLGIVGRIGLIKGAAEADAGAAHLNFGELWKSGLQYFWRFLGLSLLIGSPIFLIYLALVAGGIIAFVIAFSGPQGGSNVGALSSLVALLPVLCVLGCVIFLLAIVISFLSPQAERAIVIENEGIISGLKRGWGVLTKNLGPILVVWLILLVIGFVVGLVIALPVLVVVVPAVIAFAMSGNQASYTPLIIAGLCILAYIPVSLVANGILSAYVQSVWTLTYLRLTKPNQDTQISTSAPNA